MTFPILLIGYNRPKLIKKQLECFKKLRIDFKKIYVAIDGPKDEPGIYKTNQIRKILDSFDLDNQNLLISDTNRGCRDGCIAASNWFFNIEEKGLIIEDDCEIAASTIKYFSSTSPLLKQENIFSVSGSNPFGQASQGCVYFDESRCISELPLMWGWYTTRNSWRQINFNRKLSLLDFFKSILRFKSFSVAVYFIKILRLTNKGILDTWDTDIVWHCILNRLYCVYPTTNQVRNVGFGDDATHTKEGNSIINNEIVSSSFQLVRKDQKPQEKKLLPNPIVARRLFQFSFKQSFRLTLSELLYLVRIL